MKRNLLSAGVLALSMAFMPFMSANAQKSENSYVTNRFFDNWFISAGAGAQGLIGEGTYANSFKDHLTPAVSLSVGKYVAPGWAIRLKGDSWKVNTFGTGSKESMNYFNIHTDFMADLMSVFGTYKESRIYQLMPYVGAGLARAEGGAKSFTVNAGLINSFKVSPSVSINLELAVAAVSDDFNKSVFGGKYDGIVSAEIGATYYFKKRGFRKYDASAIARAKSLNEEVNALRGELNNKQTEIDQLNKELAAKPKEVIKEVVTEVSVQEYETVLFNINSSTVRPDQMLNISQAAEVIKKNPEAKYAITGYADKATGSVEYNLKLSEKRAQAVADILVKKFGVKAEQLEVKWDGSNAQRFENNAWNRVAIINLNPNK
ncbi:MAG: OmpA family protein [Bacteroidales bacterium]